MIIPLDITQSARDYPPLPPHLISLGSDEVLIVELQGSLTTQGDTSGQPVGTLVIDSQTNKPTLKIGHHLLEGTIQNLPKPYAVLARSSHPSIQVADDPDLVVVPAPLAQHRKNNASYNVITIVKKKIVFANRPVPIVPTSMKS
ncbi:hypothetical protein BS47DRAFT_1294919 [Hydnum rufescens UP504]|uniref:Chromosome transmission fidelity protein 8 n=1 Tax=Hydnum rufescens UP504 TaxID=1448309 RepID=A0A9P6AYZ3_9AGAM|nr:hypothetical protein BS47DRAFT_1294919 [Hydnum rufescens UP504]